MAEVSPWAMWLLYLVVFVDVFQLSFIWPLVPGIVDQFGKSATYVGLLHSVAAVGEGLASPVLGTLADRIGRKPVFVAAMVGCTVSNAVTAVAQDYWWLLAARLVVGACGGTPPVAAAYIADVTTEEERPKYMTRYQAAYYGGMGMGPFIGGLINNWAGWRVACGASAVLCAINMIGLFFLPESVHLKERRKVDKDKTLDTDGPGSEGVGVAGGDEAAGGNNPAAGDAGAHAADGTGSGGADPIPRRMACGVWLVGIAVFLENIGFISLETLGTLYIRDHFFDGDGAQQGEDSLQGATTFWTITLSCSAAVGLLTMLVVYTRLLKVLKLWGCIVVGGLVSTGCFLLLAFPLSKWAFLVEMMAISFGANLISVSGITLLTMAADPARIGQAMGIMNVFWNAASVVGPLCAGFMYEHVSRQTPWLMAAGAKAVALPVLLMVEARRRAATNTQGACGDNAAAPEGAERHPTGIHPAVQSDALCRALAREHPRSARTGWSGHQAMTGHIVQRRRRKVSDAVGSSQGPPPANGGALPAIAQGAV